MKVLKVQGNLAVIAAVIALAACGSADDGGSGNAVAEAEIRSVVAAYQKDFLARKDDAVCAKLTPAGQREVIQYGRDLGFAVYGTSCAQVVHVLSKGAAKIKQDPSKVVEVEVDGDRATAMISDGGRPPKATGLLKVKGAWLLQSSGLENPFPNKGAQ